MTVILHRLRREAWLSSFVEGLAPAISVLMLFTAWRLMLREPAPAEDRSDFSGVPPITSPVIAELGPGELPARAEAPLRKAG